MEDRQKTIADIYLTFARKLSEQPEKGLIENIAASTSGKDLHPKGADVILYTPWRYQPELMIVGNNPSWFYKGAKGEPRRNVVTQARANLSQVKGKIPTVNSYIKHHHVFSEKLLHQFRHANLLTMLENCVGLNQFWIQTGSESKIHFKDWESQLALKSLRQFCQAGTRNIAEITQPKRLWLMGTPAQNCFRDWDHCAHGVESIIRTMHPCQTLKSNQEKADHEIKDALLAIRQPMFPAAVHV
jgi:hypothetical protein